MASNDEDLQMPDFPPNSNLMSDISSSRPDRARHSGIMQDSSDPVASNLALVQNGIQDPPRRSSFDNINGTDINISSSIDYGFRQTSVPANDVPSSLSMDQQTSNFSSTDDELEDEEMEDHDNVAPYASFLPTGYCYDIRMRYHCELDPPQERRELHPEDPRRIFKIFQELCFAGLIENEMLNKGHLIPNPLLNIPVREATEAEVELVHDKRHWEFMASTQSMLTPTAKMKGKHPDELVVIEKEHDSVYFNTTTFGCALLSAGGAIEACRAVMLRRVKNAIAIIRPPGHHAEVNRPMGFCIFDNVSIAAKVCINDSGGDCRKILILDWDVHHGNGIQQAFYRDPNVLYISLHVHENGNFYPNGPYGNHLHCGGEGAKGKTINIPWPRKGMGDAEYMFAFQHVVMPVAREFDPDLVIIAAGFDAADGDQLGGCHVTPPCYAHMTHELMSLAQGQLVVCLEGGYNLRSISKSALAVTRTLVGEVPDRLSQTTQPSKEGIETVQMVAMHQSRWWPCLYPKNIAQDILITAGAERLHDAVRHYQASKLTELHNMISLSIFHEELSKSFENEVMATPDYDSKKPLLVFFHDPPEMMEVPNPITRKLELHNAWLADGLKDYIDWAVQNGFEVIDANVPKFATGTDEEDGYAQDDQSRQRKQLARLHELAEYLWDNYIDLTNSSHIFIIGVGQAYQAVVHLLNSRTTDVVRSVNGIINFVNETLISVSPQVLDDQPKWYRQHSVNLVCHSHDVWKIDQKKPSKRFGNLIQTDYDGLNDMLVEKREQVQEYILEKVRATGGF